MTGVSPRRVILGAVGALVLGALTLTVIGVPVGTVAFTLGMAAAHSPPGWCAEASDRLPREAFADLTHAEAVETAMVRDLCARGESMDYRARLEARGPAVVPAILDRLESAEDEHVCAFLLERLGGLMRAGHLAGQDKPAILARIEAALRPEVASQGRAAVELARLRNGEWGRGSS